MYVCEGLFLYHFQSLGFSKEKCDKAFTKYDTIQQALDELLGEPFRIPSILEKY